MNEHPGFYIELARKTIEINDEADKALYIDISGKEFEPAHKRDKYNRTIAKPLAKRVLELEAGVTELITRNQELKNELDVLKLQAKP